MKKLFYVLVILVLILFIKYFTGEYSITYKVNGNSVLEVYKDKSMYFEVNYDNTTYNYKFYEKRKFFKRRVKDIKVNEGCVTLDLKGYKGYSMCKDGDTLYNKVVDSDIKVNNTNDFYYNKNLSKNEYILIWKYDGFYYF